MFSTRKQLAKEIYLSLVSYRSIWANSVFEELDNNDTMVCSKMRSEL